MTKEVSEKIARGITDKIECNTVDIDDWAEFWGFTREEYEEFLDIAIKASEQEPFMNKPCVSHKVCHEDKVKVLDKIRAEITEYAIPDFEYHGCGGSQKIVELEDVLEIIDKYKAESEDKE